MISLRVRHWPILSAFRQISRTPLETLILSALLHKVFIQMFIFAYSLSVWNIKLLLPLNQDFSGKWLLTMRIFFKRTLNFRLSVILQVFKRIFYSVVIIRVCSFFFFNYLPIRFDNSETSNSARSLRTWPCFSLLSCNGYNSLVISINWNNVGRLMNI